MIPYVGWATIIVTEYPVVKFISLGALGLYSMFADNN